MRRRIKYIALIAANVVAINAYAVGSGMYLGIMMGPATNDGSVEQVEVANPPGPAGATTPAKPKTNQFGSRFFMGYQVNKYAGFEGGVNYFTGIKYDTYNVPTSSGVQARVRSLDGTVKGIMPFGNWFDVYARGGIAVVYQTTSGALNPGTNGEAGKSTYITKFRPTLSLGASYSLTQSWVLDASWNRTMVGNIVKNVDFFGIGASYHFVDHYCGQFLCDD
ncbi:MAG: outer membrane beta-barrel protein [Gammaproteobacteria bacterium]|nr:outer membrane beta-barrel protein [Gammaproteobacteria bacterium]